MSDKEPRRRKKRKDSQKKDDLHSEDQIFMPIRSESKDSDQDIEDEIPVHVHQPSGFAKLVFVILFSGLVLSMGIIFISLHGTERGANDLFDDHHSEELVVEQIENFSSIPEQLEETESLISPIDTHEEVEGWSSSSFLPGNLMDMLPDIGSFLSINNEEEKQSEVTLPSIEESDETEDQIETLSEHLSEEITDDSGVDDVSKSIEDGTVHADLSMDRTESMFTAENREEIESDLLANTESVLQHSVDDAVTESTPDYEDEDLEEMTETVTEQLSSFSSDSLEDVTEAQLKDASITDDNIPVTESMYDDDDEDTDMFTDDTSYMTTPGYEEDKLMYEKAYITSEEDFEIRDQIDELDQMLEKNMPNDEEDDDEEEEEDNDDNEVEDEFDFWQF